MYSQYRQGGGVRGTQNLPFHPTYVLPPYRPLSRSINVLAPLYTSNNSSLALVLKKLRLLRHASD